MTDLELQAFTVRHAAATKLMDAGQITGPEALAMIVVPSPDVLEASMEKARSMTDVSRGAGVAALRPRPRPHATFAELMESYAA